MKSTFSLITLLILLNLLIQCDNGEPIIETFNFENAQLQKCNNSEILYKINDTESLVLKTPESSFPNVENTRFIEIGGSTSLIYKRYNSKISENEVCIAPLALELESWAVTGGRVKIVTTKVLSTDNITVIAYNHAISFENVTFVTNGKQVAYTFYNFGNYRADLINLNFNFANANSLKCTNNNLVYKYNGSKALLLNVEQSLFANAVTTPGNPRVALINNTSNKIIYREYNGNLMIRFFVLL